MKILMVLVLSVLLLSGCGAAETLETLSDDLAQSVMGPMSEISVRLPDSAAAEVLSSEDGGKLYLCEDYALTLQTLAGGDMDRTARTLSGFSLAELTVLETGGGGLKRRDWVWTATGEQGEQLCRAAVLDDGTYHYCITVMADAEAAGALDTEWDSIFSSFMLTDTGP